MCKNAFAALEMPDATELDPFEAWLRLRHLDLSPPSPNKVDPVAGRPYLGARCSAKPPAPEPQGKTGESAVALWTWMMGPPPRCA